MQNFSLRLVLALLAAVVAIDNVAADAQAEFETFKSQFGKSYADVAEEDKRLQIFSNNLVRIEQHNADSTKTWKMGVTFLADLTPDEVEQQYMGAKPPSPTNRSAAAFQAGARQSPIFGLRAVDWRTVPAVVATPKNQGQCGSCWAFAATGALESAWRIQKGRPGYPYIMSEQYLVNCDKTEQNDGCSGGWPSASFKFLGVATPNRMPLAFKVPYEGRDGMCYPNTQYGFKVLSVEESNGDEARLMDMLAQGPTTVCIDATEFALYKSGVINKADCFTQTNHCVLAIGYDMDAGHWILQNSWGSQWGEGGFVRVALGSNMCGVADYGVRPLISRTIVAPDY